MAHGRKLKEGQKRRGLKVDSVEVLSRVLDDQRERLQMLDLLVAAQRPKEHAKWRSVEDTECPTKDCHQLI